MMPLFLLSANLVMALSVIFKFSTLPPQIPLFYSIPQGELQLAEWWFLVLFPVLMNGLFLLNTLIYQNFFEGNEFVGKFSYYFKICLIISITAIFLKIIFLVT